MRSVIGLSSLTIGTLAFGALMVNWPPRFAPPEPRQAEQGAWLDLVAFCRQLFQAAGVGPAQIEASAVCTYCSGGAFASHRRRQRLGEEKRQQYAWIARKP
ncbi:hypothetical protein Z046_18875 [Pseudomonas aeruginosa VRFPA09]|nr:hypothetical protein Z046_18875 [Pseudomonas aeruginosa VRFPA09]